MLIHIQDQIKCVEKKLGYCRRDLKDEYYCNPYLNNKNSDKDYLLKIILLNVKILELLNDFLVQSKNQRKIQFHHQVIIYQEKEVVKIQKRATKMLKNKRTKNEYLQATITELVTNKEILKFLIKIRNDTYSRTN